MIQPFFHIRQFVFRGLEFDKSELRMLHDVIEIASAFTGLSENNTVLTEFPLDYQTFFSFEEKQQNGKRKKD